MSNSRATARVPATSISSGRRSGTSIRPTPCSLSHGRNPRAAAGVQAGATAKGMHAQYRHRFNLP